jgi:hypothetical protein
MANALPKLSPDERRECLRQHLAWVAGGGARVVSQSDYSVQVVQGQRVNHLLHFFIGIFTCGAWWAIWLLLGLSRGERHTTITVDEYGRAEYIGAIRSPHSTIGRVQAWLAS